MQFQTKSTATLSSVIGGGINRRISFSGVTTEEITPENAKTQIDRVMAIVNLSVLTTGMTRSLVEEAVE